MPYKYFLIIFVFISSSLQAQNQSEIVEIPSVPISYQWPHDGATYIPAKTTIVIHPQISVIPGNSTRDFSFCVNGSKSGIHNGKVLISDDSQTILFQPDKPFVLNERVHVDFAIAGTGRKSPIRFNFQITPISDSEQCNNLRLLKTQEKEEIADFQNRYHNGAPSEINAIPLDTLPPLFPQIVIDSLDPAAVAPGNIFLSPAGSNVIAIVDNTGKPLFVRQILPNGAEDFKMELNNTLSYYKIETILDQNIFVGTVYRINSMYEVIDSFRCDGYPTDDHDFRLLPNGHALMLSYDERDTDMRVVTGNPNAAKKAKVFGAVIQELDTNKHAIYTWRSWDHFQISDMTNADLADPNNTLIDYAHVNSVEPDSDSTIIASFRNMDEVTKIDLRNGKVIWRWGGKNNFFDFVGDTLQFSHQHDVRRIANGHITMMDNGNYRKTIWGDGSYHDTSYSRAIEYDLDESSLRATALWEYRDMPYSFASGNVQRLSDGNTFIGLGAQNIPNAVEVTPSGEKVFQLSLPQNPYNYRTFRFEWPPASSVSPPVPVNSFAIGNIYPNPAVNILTIPYSVSSSGFTQIELSDVLGNTCCKLTESLTEAGAHFVSVDIHGLRNGMYYCTLSQNGNSDMHVVVIQK